MQAIPYAFPSADLVVLTVLVAAAVWCFAALRGRLAGRGLPPTGWLSSRRA